MKDPAKLARLDQLEAEERILAEELEDATVRLRAAKTEAAAARDNMRDVLSRRDPVRDEMMRLVAELSDNVQGLTNG